MESPLCLSIPTVQPAIDMGKKQQMLCTVTATGIGQRGKGGVRQDKG